MSNALRNKQMDILEKNYLFTMTGMMMLALASLTGCDKDDDGISGMQKTWLSANGSPCASKIMKFTMAKGKNASSDTHPIATCFARTAAGVTLIWIMMTVTLYNQNALLAKKDKQRKPALPRLYGAQLGCTYLYISCMQAPISSAKWTRFYPWNPASSYEELSDD